MKFGLRIMTWLLVILTLAAGSAGKATPAAADDELVRDHRDPDARVWLFVRKIIVHDDFDWGDGEINVRIFVRTNTTPCGDDDGPACGRLLVESAIPQFKASDGTTRQVNRYVPSYLDSIVDRETNPDIGIPIHLGDWYRISFIGTETDSVDDDDLGRLFVPLFDEKGQMRYGTFTERGSGGCMHLPGPLADFCAPESVVPGAFSVEYEIRPAPLPDLHPIGIKLLDAPGSSETLACMVIQNIGERDAGPFEVALKVDGVTPSGGTAAVAGLSSGQSWNACVEIPQIAGGRHTLTAAVDQPRAVVEAIETNNVYEQPYTIGQRKPSSGPARASLTVSAITVNGQVPDGKDDCTAGKNTVAVAVKNAGDAKLGSLVTRLVLDGAASSAQRQSVNDLGAGEVREVRFGDVRLKQGEHTLTVTLDVTSPGAVFDEDTSWTARVSCQSAS
jgi:hypothetical protein